ncbi:MAG: phosphate acyltransferase [Proteobacteria bacterium]|nr:MAG: phosphate acyltransferase [Pseudomonadota bacterium]
MSQYYRISLDAMGGDHGLSVTVPAALAALQQYPDIYLILVGDKAKLEAELARHNAQDTPRLSIQHASQTVGMDELPALALRNKKDSSMRVAINLVKDGQVDAAVSAGNTGALMATARFVLKTLPGIDRPAICTPIPAINGHTHVLDLGANIDSSAEHLYQFAVMGGELARAIDKMDAPKVGLLNIGQEDIKGNEQVKAANRLLKDAPLNYIGYVEGDGIFSDKVDVVVCDGFVGNVALKTSEGLAKMLSNDLKAHFSRTWWTKLAALFSMPVLKAFRNQFDPRNYNGASFLGLQGVVIKSHGGADSVSFANAIGVARKEVKAEIPKHIRHRLQALIGEAQK